jgi:hypothetical protein
LRNPGGYAVVTSPDGRREADTFTCAHCNSLVIVKDGQTADDCGGFCRLCMDLVCPRCAGSNCAPFEKKLEQQEAAYHARRSYRLAE